MRVGGATQSKNGQVDRAGKAAADIRYIFPGHGRLATMVKTVRVGGASTGQVGGAAVWGLVGMEFVRRPRGSVKRHNPKTDRWQSGRTAGALRRQRRAEGSGGYKYIAPAMERRATVGRVAVRGAVVRRVWSSPVPADRRAARARWVHTPVGLRWLESRSLCKRRRQALRWIDGTLLFVRLATSGGVRPRYTGTRSGWARARGHGEGSARSCRLG